MFSTNVPPRLVISSSQNLCAHCAALIDENPPKTFELQEDIVDPMLPLLSPAVDLDAIFLHERNLHVRIDSPAIDQCRHTVLRGEIYELFLVRVVADVLEEQS